MKLTKRLWNCGRFAMVGAFASVWSACSADRVTLVNLGPPFTSGTITAIDSTHRFVIETTLGMTAPPKVLFSVTSNTTIERPDGSDGTPGELLVGQVIAVWPVRLAPGS